MTTKTHCTFMCLMLVTASAQATDYVVTNKTELLNRAANLQPGDNLILSDGVYSDLDLTISSSGTSSQRITIKAQNPGGVTLSGQQNILINGSYITFRDFAFVNGGVGPVRKRLIELDGSYIRITGLRIEDFNLNNPASETATWIYGRNGSNGAPNQYNRIDHNWFEGKTSGGNIVHFAPQDNQYDQIDHNYFSRPLLGQNGGSSVRIGSSGQSNSQSVVEYNLFEHADGEAEIMSIKSGSTTIQHNTIINSRGELSLRRGHNNKVQNNFFLYTDASLPFANGVAVRGNYATVKDNYFDNLLPNTVKPGNAAIAVLAGNIEDVPDDTVYKHEVAKHAVISGNTVVNSSGLSLSLTTDYLQGNPSKNLLPSFITIENNRILANGNTIFDDDPGNANISWNNNTVWGGAVGLSPVPSGVVEADPGLSRDADGIMRPSLPAGAPLTVADVGPDWLATAPGQARFVSPENASSNQDPSNLTLQWTNGGGALSHKVYLGTSNNLGAADLRADQSALSFTPGSLADNTTYYWRIDQTNAQGTTTGVTWSFTTSGAGGGVNTTTLNPTDDSYTRSNFASENNGSKGFLRVRAGGTTTSYLKFAVAGISSDIVSARLRVRGEDSAINDTSLYSVADVNWSESSLTHNNAPALGSVLDSISNIQANTWVEFDVTSYINGDGSYSFALTSSQDAGGLDYYSSESANPPQLVVVFNPVSNQAPAFSANPFTKANATEASPYNASVADMATDADGDPLSFSKVSGPAWLTVATNGDLSGTPATGDVGQNTFVIKVEDDQGASATASLNIVVDAAAVVPTSLFADDFENNDIASVWSVSGVARSKSGSAFTGLLGGMLKRSASIQTSIDTRGYSDITVTWDSRLEGFDSGESLSLQWSADGVSWNSVATNTQSVWQNHSLVLPGGAEGVANLGLRFITNANNNRERAHLDNIQITGE